MMENKFRELHHNVQPILEFNQTSTDQSSSTTTRFVDNNQSFARTQQRNPQNSENDEFLLTQCACLAIFHIRNLKFQILLNMRRLFVFNKLRSNRSKENFQFHRLFTHIKI